MYGAICHALRSDGLKKGLMWRYLYYQFHLHFKKKVWLDVHSSGEEKEMDRI